MSVITQYQISGVNPTTVGGKGTSIKYFPNSLGPAIGKPPAAPTTTSAVGQLAVPALNKLNGQPFRVRAFGNVLTGPAGGGQVTIVLQAQTSQNLAGPVYITIAGTGAITLSNNTLTPWFLDVNIEGDTLTGIIAGYYIAALNGTLKGGANPVFYLDNGLSGINFGSSPQNAPPNQFAFGLVVGVTFSSSDQANNANMNSFQLSVD